MPVINCPTCSSIVPIGQLDAKCSCCGWSSSPYYQALEDASNRAAALVESAIAATRKRKPSKRRGNCYVTCEALYHLLGGKAAGLVPHTVKHEGDTHWYLIKMIYQGIEGPGMGGVEHKIYTHVIIDPTLQQFKTTPPYIKGRARGFLTKEPSKRARALMDQMLWQSET